MIKIQYKGTNKKINIASINNFNQFIEKVQRSFRNLTQGYVCYYIDSDNDKIDIQDDEDYQCYKNQINKGKVYIKDADENYIDVQNNSSKLNNDNQILTKSIKKQLSAQSREQNSSNLRKEQIEKQQEVKNIEQKIQKEEKLQSVNITVHKNIKCVHCKGQVIGIRWKCLDQFDTDVCSRCYDAKQHKAGHNFLKIQTQDYLLKINYYDSIYRLFNPNYEAEKPSNKVKPWIKEEDIVESNPEAIKEIWNASKHIAQKVANQYADWEKQWQKINKKEEQLIKN